MKYIGFIILSICTLNGLSQDRYFAQTYTSNVLQKGGVDLELWHTSRFGRETGFYHGMDQRMELEVGLGGQLQTALYFNRFQEMRSDSNNLITKSEIGLSNEWKYLVTKPTSKYGIALYAEFGLKGDEIEWEGKFIVDHTSGKNLFALNIVGEVEEEIEKQNGKFRFHTSQTPISLVMGYMRYPKPAIGYGFEVRNNNRIAKGNWENSILFAGPTCNYRSDKWFVILNYLPQLINIRKTVYSPANKVLDTHERNEARIILGISL